MRERRLRRAASISPLSVYSTTASSLKKKIKKKSNVAFKPKFNSVEKKKPNIHFWATFRYFIAGTLSGRADQTWIELKLDQLWEIQAALTKKKKKIEEKF